MTLRTCLSFLAAGWLITSGVSAQDDGPPTQTFRSSVDVVTLHTTVRDRDGRPLRGLRQNDFTVLDNGERRAIRLFQADETAAVSAAFLVDVSGSMSVGDKRRLAEDVFRHALQALRSGHDEAALFTFDTRVDQRQPFTSDLFGLAAMLRKIEPFGSTSLYDMVADTTERIRTAPSGHAALIVITDGFDTSSTRTGREVAALANAANVPIYVVATTAPADRAAAADGDENAGKLNLRDLAAWSGGNALVASTPVEARSAAAALVQELRHQYVLGIDAAASGDWRSLEVQVRAKGATVRARSGYFGKSGRS
jgi:VWFA-related protein